MAKDLVQMNSAYPPSFGESPLSYGFALFSLTLICAFAIAMLMHMLFESRARHAVQQINSLCAPPPQPFTSPLSIHRMIVAGFLITVLCGAFPDVLVLFAWGEASNHTINVLLLADRIGDGMTFVPFSISVGLSAWSSQIIPQQLMRDKNVKMAWPRWHTMKDQLKITAMVLIIASGVTVAKATAGT